MRTPNALLRLKQRLPRGLQPRKKNSVWKSVLSLLVNSKLSVRKRPKRLDRKHLRWKEWLLWLPLKRKSAKWSESASKLPWKSVSKRRQQLRL